MLSLLPRFVRKPAFASTVALARQQPQLLFSAQRRAFAGPGGQQKRPFFTERAYRMIALLVSVPTAVYLWNRRKTDGSSSAESSGRAGNAASATATTTATTTPSATMTTKYLIVGGGVAGFSAIEAILANDPEGQVLLVSEEAHLPYLRPALSKELWKADGFFSNAADSSDLSFTDWQGKRKPLLLEPESFYARSGVAVKLATRVRSIDPGRRIAVLEDGSTVRYAQALIATGARPKPLPGSDGSEDGRAVRTFRSLDDFLDLKRSLLERSGQRILVVGGGFLGAELAASLAQLPAASSIANTEPPAHVTQVFPESGPMALVFPKYLSEWTRDKLASLGVRVIPRVTVKSIVPAESGAQVNVTLSDGTSLVADHVVVAVGVEPNLPQLPKGMTPVVNSRLQLLGESSESESSLFGAGDAIEYPDVLLGGSLKRTEHYDHAVQSGKTAGENMVRAARGEPLKEYTHESMFWSDLGKDIGYEAVGLVDSSLTTVSVWAQAGPADRPARADLDPSDIRIQRLGQTTVRSEIPAASEAASAADETTAATEDSGDDSEKIPQYGKGVVLYLKDQKIVGVLLFNLFNRVNLARSLISEGFGVDDINKAVRLVNIHDEQ